MTKPHLLVIANPAAGSAKNYRRQAAMLQAELLVRDWSYDWHETAADHPIATLVREKQHQHSDILVIGGDGTLHHTINGMTTPVPLSIVPTGTGNDYVKNLDLPKNPDKILDMIEADQRLLVDLGVCNGRKFLNGIGVGFDGQIVADMLQTYVPVLSGHAKYYYHVLRILSTYRERDLTYQQAGQTHVKKLLLLTVAKGTTFGGGFRLTPQGRLDSGKLAICQIGRIGPVRRFLNVGRLSKGTHAHLKEVTLFDTESLCILEQPLVEAHIDGEYLGKPPFDIKVSPRALSIRALGFKKT